MNFDRDFEDHQKPSCTVGRMRFGVGTAEISMVGPPRLKIEFPYDPAIAFLVYTIRKQSWHTEITADQCLLSLLFFAVTEVCDQLISG